MSSVFVAYASGNEYHKDLIEEACRDATTPDRRVTPWSGLDTSGRPIAKSVEEWIETADAFVGDISIVNDNVTYEIGYALGQKKPVRLVRSTHFDLKEVKSVGLLDTLGHDSYDFSTALCKILKKTDDLTKWPEIDKNKDQPVFILQPPKPNDWSLRFISSIKKIARVRFRSFSPSEISRLNASEAYEQALSSFGIVVFWVDGNTQEATRSNQRASFLFGLARGVGLPALLIAHEKDHLPLDLHDHASRWGRLEDLDKLVATFRDNVADLQSEYVQFRPVLTNLLEHLHCGDPVAENEAAALSTIFLETDGYRKALEGQVNVLVGRKGSGKTAVFLQVRDRTRAIRENIVIDLIPDGHQLIKMKEVILEKISLGSRKELVAAFWEYVLWLEIAYKLLEKDEKRAARDPKLLVQYRTLEELFRGRVDTGLGDFSERLTRLSENMQERFEKNHDDLTRLDSSKVLEIVYGQDVRQMREAVLEYLRIKGIVLFLFDNLDRFWTPGGFDESDALIIVGLIESMQEITRKFARRSLEFRWGIFVRSDVYEFLIRGMADYGKLAVQSLEWSDRELLKALFEQRLRASVTTLDRPWSSVWTQSSVQAVDGKPVLDFLVDGSLMRPRYLIRLFEIARRRAITFRRSQIAAEDYTAAIKELGWQVLEDLDREISDLVPTATDLLFTILQNSADLTPDKLRYISGRKLSNPDLIEKLINVMIWNGSLGVDDAGEPKYIFDCGYKRQYLASIIGSNPNVKLSLHPTLLASLR